VLHSCDGQAPAQRRGGAATASGGQGSARAHLFSWSVNVYETRTTGAGALGVLKTPEPEALPADGAGFFGAGVVGVSPLSSLFFFLPAATLLRLATALAAAESGWRPRKRRPGARGPSSTAPAEVVQQGAIPG